MVEEKKVSRVLLQLNQAVEACSVSILATLAAECVFHVSGTQFQVGKT